MSLPPVLTRFLTEPLKARPHALAFEVRPQAPLAMDLAETFKPYFLKEAFFLMALPPVSAHIFLQKPRPLSKTLCPSFGC